MKMLKLLATRSHKYGTRHLTAGDEYEAPIRQAVALVAGRKARFAPDQPTRRAAEMSGAKISVAEPLNAESQAEATVAEEAASAHSLDGLRLQATQLGIEIDGRWGVARLQHEIAQAKR